MADIAAAFEHVFGYPLDGPRPRVHPEQQEADERRIERAERDAEFERAWGR